MLRDPARSLRSLKSSGARRTVNLESRFCRPSVGDDGSSSIAEVRSTAPSSCFTSADSVIPSREAAIMRSTALVSEVTRQLM